MTRIIEFAIRMSDRRTARLRARDAARDRAAMVQWMDDSLAAIAREVRA